MTNYRRNSFKLQRLYEVISEDAETKAYISFSYQEFYDMFVKECINGKIPRHRFIIKEEGFLDPKGKFPYANIQVDFDRFSKRKQKINPSTKLAETSKESLM